MCASGLDCWGENVGNSSDSEGWGRWPPNQLHGSRLCHVVGEGLGQVSAQWPCLGRLGLVQCVCVCVPLCKAIAHPLPGPSWREAGGAALFGALPGDPRSRAQTQQGTGKHGLARTPLSKGRETWGSRFGEPPLAPVLTGIHLRAASAHLRSVQLRCAAPLSARHLQLQPLVWPFHL